MVYKNEDNESLFVSDSAPNKKKLLEFYKSYKELLKKKYKEQFGDNLISQDFARYVFDDMGYDKLNPKSAELFSEVAWKLTEELTNEALERNKNNKNKNIIILAGGTGSGKTTLAREYAKRTNYPIVFDTNIANYDATKKRIQKYIDAGFKPTIVYKYREPFDAYKNGIIPRLNEDAHLITVDHHLRSHNEVRENFIKLIKEFGTNINPKVVEVIKGKKTEISLDNLISKPYNKDELKLKIDNELEKALRGNKIGREVFTRATGREQDIIEDRGRSHTEGRGEAKKEIRERGTGKEEKEPPVTPRQITTNLANSLGLELSKQVKTQKDNIIKRFAKRAIGLYFEDSGIIRIRSANDIRTFAHELGHKLDFENFYISKKYKFDKNDNLERIVTLANGRKEPQRTKLLSGLRRKYGVANVDLALVKAEVRKELKSFAVDTKHYSNTLTETVANYIDHYITNRDYTISRNPKFSAIFESFLDNSPEIKSAIDSATKQYEDFKNLSPEEKLKTQVIRNRNISWLEGLKKKIDPNNPYKWDFVYKFILRLYKKSFRLILKRLRF